MKLISWQKILAMSKLFLYVGCLQALFATITIADTGNAQVLEQTYISYNWQNLKLEEAFSDIQNQTDFFFTFDRTQVTGISVSGAQEHTALADLLKYISSKTGLMFRITKDLILVKYDDDSAAAATTMLDKNMAIRVSEDEITQLIDTKSTKVIYEIGLAEINEDQIVRGTVTSTVGEPLIGAAVVVKETGQGTVTDNSGNFTIAVPDEGTATLVVSYIGYQTTEVSISGQTQIDIQLAVASTELNEVVVIGYGTESRAKVTTAIAKLKNEDIKDQPITSFDQGLAGRLPGVQISQSSGAPSGGVSINIRGTASISGGTAPLVVVDGVPISSSVSDRFAQGAGTADGRFPGGYILNPLSTINPNDIESIEVLKDAAAAAIYGSRGSNGVILITTKQGSRNAKTQISLNAYGGVQEVTNMIDVADAYEFAEFSKFARDVSWVLRDPTNNSPNDPNSVRTSGNDRYAEYFTPYLNGEQGLTNTDWQDEIFRQAPIQNYELSASGGTDRLSYYVSGNYFNQEGIVINSGMERFGARLNLQADLTDRLKFGVNFNPTFSQHNLVQTEANWWREGVIITALMYHPNLPVRNPDGSLALGELIRTNNSGESTVARIENPVALAELVENNLDHMRILGNTFLELDILGNLRFKTSFGVDMNAMDRNFYRPRVLNHHFEEAPTESFNIAWSNAFNSLNWLSENTLDYFNSFGDHNFSVLLGFTSQRETNERVYLEGSNFPNDQVTTLNAAQATTGFSEEREWSLLSYLGRIQYDFAGKYLLSASLRRDGSSRFGQNTKWGWFPSVSAGWRISEEDFFNQDGFLSDLKLRASYGETGNTEIPFYGAISTLESENYPIGGSVNNGLSPNSSPNPDLSWETTRTINIGAEFGFFEDRLFLTADYYNSTTEDLLLNVTVPASSGFTSSLQNIGEIENRGFELGLNANLKLGPVNWNAGANISTNENEVLALGPGQDQFLSGFGLGNTHIVRVGSPIGSFFGYRVLGIIQNEEQLNSTPTLPNQGVGDFIYEDVNGDGVLNENDRTIIGNANPDFIFGFSSAFAYKGFDFSFNIQGVQGAEVLNTMNRYLAESWGNVFSKYAVGFFQSPQNSGDGETPRPVWGVNSRSHTTPSTFLIEDASFIRVRNITLGYTLPPSAFGNALGNVRVYFSALNPFTFTDYPLYNPEVSNDFGNPVRAGEDFGNYPIARSFVAGLNVNF